MLGDQPDIRRPMVCQRRFPYPKTALFVPEKQSPIISSWKDSFPKGIREGVFFCPESI